MKLQFKLALYNALTKAAIIVFLGILIITFTRKISVNHIEERLKEKRTKIIAQLSEPEIRDFLNRQGNYTDYNLLHEEYFTLNLLSGEKSTKKEKFTQEVRNIEGSEQQYQILTQDFKHNNHFYRLELGETLSTVDLLEKTITGFTFLVLGITVAITLLSDLFFTRLLLAPFYRIINDKINMVNDPIHFNYTPVKTTTQDFVVLDESLNMLMNKFKNFLLTQKEFIANVSHELLTPISVLKVRMENLLNEEKLSPEGENKVFANLKTLQRLKAIINSLLMISKIENSQYLKDDRISVQETVQEVIAELEHRLLMKSLTIENSITQDMLFQGNASLFNILITNLLSNAIKYNIDHGTITVSTVLVDDGLALHITDTGRGMDQSEIERVFGRFEQLNAGDEESHGLGLAIVKHVADFHGIKVSITSAKGEGTTVVLRIKNNLN